MVKRLLNILILFFLFSFCGIAVSAPNNTLSITPSGTSGTTITASDENSRNSTISSIYNAHSHTDISDMSDVNTFRIGDGSSANKTYSVNDDQASDPSLRFDTSNDIWTLSADGSTFDAIGISSGSVISGENRFRIGDGTGIGNKRLIANEDITDGEIRWNVSDDAWEFSNDGSTFNAIGVSSGSVVSAGNEFNVGDGTEVGNKYIFANTTSAAEDPAIVYRPGGSEWLISSSTGVYVPLSSSLFVRLQDGSNQSILDSAETAITFDTELSDSNDMHDAINSSRIKFPLSGVYCFGANMEYAFDADGFRRGYIRLNGSTEIADQQVEPGQTTPEASSLILSSCRSFSSGDYIELIAHHGAGNALNVTTASERTPIFWAAWQGE